MARTAEDGYRVRLTLSPKNAIESEIIARQREMTSAAARRSHIRRLMRLGHEVEKEQRKAGEGALAKISEILSENVKSEPPLPFRRKRIEESSRREQDQDAGRGSGREGQRLEEIPTLGVTPDPDSRAVLPVVEAGAAAEASAEVPEIAAVVEPAAESRPRRKLRLDNLFMKAE